LKADRQQNNTLLTGLYAAVPFGYAVFLEDGTYTAVWILFLKITTLAHFSIRGWSVADRSLRAKYWRAGNLATRRFDARMF
jgi:hypothetical protein